MTQPLNITILGLSITSSWGNGHATTFRHLVKALTDRGHAVTFLERDQPWYASNRDLPEPPFGKTILYDSLEELRDTHAEAVRTADLVIVGSYVPEGIAVGQWAIETATAATAFYDIDTPVTLARLERDDCEYLSPELIARYDLYLSFAGGPTLELLENRYGSPKARPFYCSVDPEEYQPLDDVPVEWDLGYLGTYSDDRQPTLEHLLNEPARMWPEGKFVVAGPQYPADIAWPTNVERIDHVPPGEHARFYNRQRFTLNVTRADMIEAGYSPSVRLFEASACGVPIISDYWQGLEQFFNLGEELLVARPSRETIEYLRNISEAERRTIGSKARERVLRNHTAAHRALELEQYLDELSAVK